MSKISKNIESAKANENKNNNSKTNNGENKMDDKKQKLEALKDFNRKAKQFNPVIRKVTRILNAVVDLQKKGLMESEIEKLQEIESYFKDQEERLYKEMPKLS